jgi:hypothetical protein
MLHDSTIAPLLNTKPEARRPLVGKLALFAKFELDDWAAESVPSGLRDELGEVATLVATAECVTNLDFAVLGGALVFGLRNVAVLYVD